MFAPFKPNTKIPQNSGLRDFCRTGLYRYCISATTSILSPYSLLSTTFSLRLKTRTACPGRVLRTVPGDADMIGGTYMVPVEGALRRLAADGQSGFRCAGAAALVARCLECQLAEAGTLRAFRIYRTGPVHTYVLQAAVILLVVVAGGNIAI